MELAPTYQEIKASPDLEDLIHSFWVHRNLSDVPQRMSIVPDGFFKIIFQVREGKIANSFMTGLWTKSKEFTVLPKTLNYGCRLKILAPEFLLHTEIASLLDGMKRLEDIFLNPEQLNLSDFENLAQHWEFELRQTRSAKAIPINKLHLSQLVYKMKGSISASEVSNQVCWSNRQINRYLNKYLGVSLKKYLNIQKCYASYPRIREGAFYPEHAYFDQAHFIKEVKKHTGVTPKILYQGKNDRFIQFGNIKEE